MNELLRRYAQLRRLSMDRLRRYARLRQRARVRQGVQPRSSVRRSLVASASIAAVLVAASAEHPTFASSPPAPQPRIDVRAAWIRWLPAGLPAAGYLTLTNTGDHIVALESASSPAYGEVSIHRTVTRGGVEEMMPVKELELEPHQTLQFESTGYHLMLMQPAASADASATIPITLRFSDGSQLTVPFEVRRNRGGGSGAAAPDPP